MTPRDPARSSAAAASTPVPAHHTGQVAAVIPARYGSTRFPGKPLACETGKPLIQHVVEQVQKARKVDKVIVATDDPRIRQAVEAFGGQAVMTRDDHPNGTSRIAEAVAGLPATFDLIINVQGDEPEMEPELIDRLIDAMHADQAAPMATLASPFADDEDPAGPNIVKVVVSQQNRALYFSRALIPFDRDRQGAKPLKHPGMYAYRRSFLPIYVALPPSPLEGIEQLEQLRALEHGHPIAIVQATVRHHGIDTPQQYADFVQRHRARQA